MVRDVRRTSMSGRRFGDTEGLCFVGVYAASISS